MQNHLSENMYIVWQTFESDILFRLVYEYIVLIDPQTMSTLCLYGIPKYEEELLLSIYKVVV
jgi:hypothetical protein